jgi:hypothetical protein
VAVAGALFLATAEDKWANFKFMAVTKYGVLGPDLKPIKIKKRMLQSRTTGRELVRQEEMRQLKNLSNSRRARIWQMHAIGKSIPALQRQFSLSRFQIEQVLSWKN